MPAQDSAKICIVSGELNRLFRNGGIGTACTGLAQLLAAHGYRVTVLYTGELSAVDQAGFRTLADFYARELGVSIALLRKSALLGNARARVAAHSLCVYHQLRDGDWDAVFFNDVSAEGFYSVLAKRSGLAFQRTALCVVAHGPRTWVRELNRWPLTCGNGLEQVFMEREMVRFADHLISPSRYMLDWLASDGWQLPNSRRVVKCRLPRWRRSPDVRALVERSPVRELVFFGRLEYRKGVTLFCDAVDELAMSHTGLLITFLGRFGDVLGEHGGGYVLRRAHDWPFELRFLPGLDQHEALDYLRGQPAALPVIPSLVDNLPCVVNECLQEGLPFVATDTGGIPELVADEDRELCLCAPDPQALATAIRAFLDTAPCALRPAETPEAIDGRWLATFDYVLAHRSAWTSASGAPAPPVSVVLLTHAGHADPATLRSIEAQVDADVEIEVARVTKRDPGVARRAAIQGARAEHVLLVDDGAVLTTAAVSQLLRVAETTGADITTAFAYDRDEGSPPDTPTVSRLGVGNAREAGYCRNVFGGTTALVRKSALEKAGLLERESFGQDMWASYCEASFAGLDIVCVPEPLGWDAPPVPHAQSQGGPHPRVREVFEHNDYRECDLLFDLLAGHVEPTDAHPNLMQLAATEHGALLEQLGEVDPESTEALALMAIHATRTQRSQTARELDALVDAPQAPPPSVLPVQPGLGASLAEQGREHDLTLARADMGSVVLAPGCQEIQDEHAFPLVQVDRHTPAVQVHPVLGREISGTLAMGAAQGLREVRATAFLANAAAPPVEYRLAVANTHSQELVAESAWTQVEDHRQRALLRLTVPPLGAGDYDLVLSTRIPGDRMTYAHARFGDIHLVFGGSKSAEPDDRSASGEP